MEITRRRMVVSTASAVLGMQARGLLQTPTLDTEPQKGDPDVTYESLTYDPSAIEALWGISGRATFEPWQRGLPGAMLSTARGCVKFSREANPERISEFLELFGMGLKDQKGDYVPYCAAGLSYCAIQTFARTAKPGMSLEDKVSVMRSLAADVERYYFYPTVSCRKMWLIAQGKDRWISHVEKPGVVPRPGWIVLFDWGKTGIPDHCGIVRNATAQRVFTVEFNTSGSDTGGSPRNGGTVAEKERTYSYVLGFIATDQAPPRL